MIGHETTWSIWQNKQTDISSDSDSCVNWVLNIQSLQAFMAVPFGMINAAISLVSPFNQWFSQLPGHDAICRPQ